MKLLFTSICTSIYTLICTSLAIGLYSLPCVAQQWMTIKHALVVEIKTDSSSSQLRFLLNNTDVTSRFKHTHGYQYIYRAKGFPLPSGVNNLTVYQVLEGQWQEIHSQEIKVLTSSGYETADWRMSGSVSVDAQLDAEYTGDAFKPENTRFRVANLQLNLSSQHSRKDFSIQTQANIVGTSKQENALRFYQSDKKADKVDLSDYLVTVKKGKLRLSVGHYGFGSNPLLVDNLGNRGIHVGYRLNRVFDLGITRQNGSAIVGWSNLLGQQNSQHSITASTIGAEVFPNEPGKLRIEMSYLDAQVQAINDFAIGQVSDVEKNQGWGVSIASQLWDGRMRFNGVFASSRYTNPDDEALLLGEEFELQSVKSSTDQAYQVNLELDLLTQQGQGTDFFTASLQLALKKPMLYIRSLLLALLQISRLIV
ncbi:MAG: hypothetical protein JKY14_12525 [Paraglaciecola sp.]|nr:hypothetical protein [Paraglaciecola sp.]